MQNNLVRIKQLVPLLILLVSALWILFSRIDRTQLDSLSSAVPFVGFQAPDFEVLNSKGESVQLSDFRGKPVMLNFWASWCSPCRAEMPAMQNIYQEYRDQGFEILAVNSTSQDSIASATEFADELDLSFPILFDQSGNVTNQYKIQALPSSFFIDSNGLIQEIVIGGPMSEALLHIRVQKLVEER